MNSKKNKFVNVSFICSAIRPYMWHSIARELSIYKTPHEIIFVGPLKPKKKLPFNTTFIESDVKPAQCIEIAARAAKGKYLCLIADDCSFTKFDLDELAAEAEKNDDNKVIVGTSFGRNNTQYDISDYRYWSDSKNSPSFLLCPLFPRKLWMELGGIDIRFLHSYGDLDLQLRANEKGYTFLRKENIFLIELMRGNLIERIAARTALLIPKYISSFFSRLMLTKKVPKVPLGTYLHREISHDRKILDSLWIYDSNESSRDYYSIREDGKAISKCRIDIVKSFSDEDLTLKSQGPTGRW